MIVYDYYNKEKTLVIAKSDNNKFIHKVGTTEEYSEAIDLIDHIDTIDGTPRSRFKYEETNKDIPTQEWENTRLWKN